MFNHLTYFYLFYAIKHYVYFLTAKSMYRVEFKTQLVEDIIRNLKPEHYENVPALNLYYNILMLFLREEDVSYFHKVKKLADEYEGCLNRYEVLGVYVNLENYCKRMIRKGSVQFVRELFEIYKIYLNKKVYALQREMSAKFYRGVVETALKLEEFNWAKEFIEKYRSELAPDSRENTYYYSLALYEFALKNFEKSLELVSKVKYSETYHKTELRCLLAQLYFELGMDDLLLSHIDSFRHFLANDKLIPDERKKYYQSFIKYAKGISMLKGKNKKQELDNLNRRILADTAVYNKEWLLDKAEEIAD